MNVYTEKKKYSSHALNTPSIEYVQGLQKNIEIFINLNLVTAKLERAQCINFKYSRF